METVARATIMTTSGSSRPTRPTSTEQRMTSTHRGNGGSHAGRLLLAPALVLLAQCATAPGRATTTTPTPAATTQAVQGAPPPNAAEVRLHNDWPWLERYRQANAALAAPAPGEDRVVFYGNSITEGWAQYFASEFPGKPYIGRGIS